MKKLLIMTILMGILSTGYAQTQTNVTLVKDKTTQNCDQDVHFTNIGNTYAGFSGGSNVAYAAVANVASNLTENGSNAFYLAGVKVVAATNADYAAVANLASNVNSKVGSATNADYSITSGIASNLTPEGSNAFYLAGVKVSSATNADFAVDTNAQATANYASNAIALAPIRITDARFFLAGLNQAAQSVRAKFSISQKNTGRSTDKIFVYTNQLYYSCTSTVAGVAGEFTNVVDDASGFIAGDMYTKPDTSSLTWQTCSNGAGTVVYWLNEPGMDVSSNLVNNVIGSTISRVNRLRVPDYIDATDSSNVYCRIAFLTPYTNTVGINVTYWSGTNFFTYTNNIVVSNSQSFVIPYVK